MSTAYSRRLYLALIFLLSVAPLSRVHAAGDETGSSADLPTFSPAELQAAYDGLPGEEKALIADWPPEERELFLKSKAWRKRIVEQSLADKLRLEKESAGRLPEPVPVRYELEPMLKRAYLAYMDPKRPRDEVISLFEQYLNKEPNSVFLPEIYFRIGALYSIHRRINLGEEKDGELQKRYYEKAHELYGDTFSYLNNTAWASLANAPYSTLGSRKKYYDWLLKLQKGISADVIYPVREIQGTFNGRLPVMDANERVLFADGLKHNIAQFVKVAEENILWRTSYKYDDLVDLAASYPNTELGKQANLRLQKLDKSLLQGLISGDDALRSSDFKLAQPSAEVAQNTRASAVVADSREQRSKPLEDNLPVKRRPASVNTVALASTRRWQLIAAFAGLALLVIVSVGIMLAPAKRWTR